MKNFLKFCECASFKVNFLQKINNFREFLRKKLLQEKYRRLANLRENFKALAGRAAKNPYFHPCMYVHVYIHVAALNSLIVVFWQHGTFNAYRYVICSNMYILRVGQKFCDILRQFIFGISQGLSR